MKFINTTLKGGMNMINYGKYPILGINIHAVDYDSVVSAIVSAAKEKRPCAVSALAVHGVMTGVLDEVHHRRLNGIDVVVPDGQPVRWALWLLHRQKLSDRVYGPNLTLQVAQAFAEQDLSLYLYGSQMETLTLFAKNLTHAYPRLKIVGMEPSKFRRLTEQERYELVERIQSSGANAVFLGLGCPRQEVWAYEYRDLLGIPILAVGAAFDFHAGTLPQAPKILQDMGLEWGYRLIQEPKRLWRRYVLLNPLYIWNIFLQYWGLKRFTPLVPNGSEKIESYG
jgi:N-acetylglucosaminyldiphosphoundecaprenol N-acetyl-beta-D-mannosaminyltransferase